jgi:plasmid stabilization system protein ParE
MKNLPIEILESAEPDLRYAQDFYSTWRPAGADVFLKKFRETASWVKWNPGLFPQKYKFFRRAIIRRSHFAIYYVIEPDKSVIVAVLDMRRNPQVIHALLGRRWCKK